jgi:thymidylate synthase (FAD)
MPMKIIKAKAEIVRPSLTKEAIDAIYKNIEIAGRTCYKSEDKITPESARKFVRALIKRGHEAMIEHASMTVKFTVDRGVSHEIVRHRIASYAQESTRYCNYSNDKFSNEITVIEPCVFNELMEKRKKEIRKIVDDDEVWAPNDLEYAYFVWYIACKNSEKAYMHLIERNTTPEIARSVLLNSLKTEIVVTMNMREWRHFFKLRAAGITGKPHPQMVEVALPLLRKCQELMPELFDDIKIGDE